MCRAPEYLSLHGIFLQGRDRSENILFNHDCTLSDKKHTHIYIYIYIRVCVMNAPQYLSSNQINDFYLFKQNFVWSYKKVLWNETEKNFNKFRYFIFLISVQIKSIRQLAFKFLLFMMFRIINLRYFLGLYTIFNLYSS